MSAEVTIKKPALGVVNYDYLKSHQDPLMRIKAITSYPNRASVRVEQEKFMSDSSPDVVAAMVGYGNYNQAELESIYLSHGDLVMDAVISRYDFAPSERIIEKAIETKAINHLVKMMPYDQVPPTLNQSYRMMELSSRFMYAFLQMPHIPFQEVHFEMISEYLSDTYHRLSSQDLAIPPYYDEVLEMFHIKHYAITRQYVESLKIDDWKKSFSSVRKIIVNEAMEFLSKYHPEVYGGYVPVEMENKPPSNVVRLRPRRHL